MTEAPTWDLGDLYRGPDDPALERDLTQPVADAQAFEARYRGRVAELDAAQLAQAVAEQEALLTPLYRAGAYASLRFATDTADPAPPRALRPGPGAGNGRAVAPAVLRPGVAGRRRRPRRRAAGRPGAGRLPPPPRGRATLQAAHADRARGAGPHQAVADRAVRVAAPLHHAVEHDHGRPAGRGDLAHRGAVRAARGRPRDARHRGRRDQRRAGARPRRPRDRSSTPCCHDKALRDDLRSYPHWIATRNLANEASDEQVEALVQAVVRRYDLVGRWYRLKGRLLGIDDLADHDRYAPLPGAPEHVVDVATRAATSCSTPTRTSRRAWPTSPASTSSAAGSTPRSRPAKRTGAFCASTVPSVHPYVFVNWTGTARDVMTVAHELGHGVHMRLSQEQTLFNIVDAADHRRDRVDLRRGGHVPAPRAAGPRRPRRASRCSPAASTRAIATIFRQVAMNRYEDAVHTAAAARAASCPPTVSASSGWRPRPRCSTAPWSCARATAAGGATSRTSSPRPATSTPTRSATCCRSRCCAAGRTTPRRSSPPTWRCSPAAAPRPPRTWSTPLGVDLSDPGFWDAGLDVFEGLVAEAEALAEL